MAKTEENPCTIEGKYAKMMLAKMGLKKAFGAGQQRPAAFPFQNRRAGNAPGRDQSDFI